VKALASDLAKKVSESEFKKQRKWFVDGDKLEDRHLLTPFIQTNCWPPCSVIHSFGDKWDELLLLSCFEILNALDPQNSSQIGVIPQPGRNLRAGCVRRTQEPSALTSLGDRFAHQVGTFEGVLSNDQ
jgi:hypothetical protein